MGVRFHALVCCCLWLMAGAAADAWAQSGLRRDAEGWTIFIPSPDSRIIYVDSASGNDAAGAIYGAASPEVGADPFRPTRAIRPYRTIAAARAKLRGGSPDWMLLRRGGVWHESLGGNPPSGRSAGERMLIAWYGDTGAMPLLKTGVSEISNVYGRNLKFCNVAFVGIDFYAHTRDPLNPGEYTSPAGVDGFHLVCDEGAPQSLLWEGCRVRDYRANFSFEMLKPGVIPSDIVIRRCAILDAYSPTTSKAHSSGLYSHWFELTVEECVFDHNGWAYPAIKGGDVGLATMFNHNTYCGEPRGHTFRGNMFLRASSIGNKWRGDVPGGAYDIVVDDNFYAEGEIGISLGGNLVKPNLNIPGRFLRSRVTNNVLMHIGRTQPTNRALAWYMELIDNEDAVVADNLFLRQDDTRITNAFALNVKNSQKNVRIKGNVVYNLNNQAFLVSQDTGVPAVRTNLVFDSNELQQPRYGGPLVQFKQPLAGSTGSDTVSFLGNVYDSAAKGNWFNVNGAGLGAAAWTQATREKGARWGLVKFPDPGRGIESYQAQLGETATFDAFVAKARAQGRFNWDQRYTAPAVNHYIRAGFRASSPASGSGR